MVFPKDLILFSISYRTESTYKMIFCVKTRAQISIWYNFLMIYTDWMQLCSLTINRVQRQYYLAMELQPKVSRPVFQTNQSDGRSKCFDSNERFKAIIVENCFIFLFVKQKKITEKMNWLKKFQVINEIQLNKPWVR